MDLVDNAGTWTDASRRLLRYYEYSQRVQIHIASWPAEFEMPDPEKQPWLYHETGEASYRASQFMAIEGQTFVLVASQIITEGNLEKNNLLGNHVTKTVGSKQRNPFFRFSSAKLTTFSREEAFP